MDFRLRARLRVPQITGSVTASGDIAVSTLPSWLPAVGEWAEISGTAISSVEPDPLPGGTGPEGKVNPWISYAVDTRTSKVYCVANGGHTDYAGNEADVLALATETPVWTELLPPSSPVTTADYYADGRPVSRHTYYGVWMDEANDRVMLVGGSRYIDGAVLATVDSFDIIGNDYNPSGTHPNIPTNASTGTNNQEVRGCCMDPSTGDIYVFANFNVVKWTRSTNTWSAPISNQTAPFIERAGSAFDTTRGRIFIVGDGDCTTYDVAGNAFTARTLTGTDISATDWLGVQYVEAIDRFIVRAAAAGGTVYEIHPTTFACSEFSTSGGASIPAAFNSAGPLNKFLYVPAMKGCVYVASYTGNAWFLRVHS